MRKELQFVLRAIVIVVLLLSSFVGNAQHSVARQWNEVLLEAIRNDYAKTYCAC